MPITHSAPRAPYLTVAEVAAELKLHPMSIRRWMRTQRLPFVKLGGAVRIASVDLDKFLNDGRNS